MTRLITTRRYLVIFSIGVAAVWLLLSQPERGNIESELNSAEMAGSEEKQGKLVSRSMFLEEYGSESSTTLNDLKSVYFLITDCQMIFKNLDSFFLPDNQAITAFLRGENPEKIIWIPSSHFAVNENGELLDRFGTPLFFHRISGLKFEIYSAGDDLKMWTDDDLIYPPVESE